MFNFYILTCFLVDGNIMNLPRTIIFMSDPEQATRFAMALRLDSKIHVYIARENANKSNLPLRDFTAKQVNVIILITNTFLTEPIYGVNAVINYNLPETIENYARQLEYIEHQKCITYILPKQDRALLSCFNTVSF